MRHTADVIKEIRATAGKNDKRQILKDNEFNTELKAVLKLAYDKSFNYYTTVIPKNLGPVKGLNTLEYALSVMVDQLSKRKVTGKAAKSAVKDLFQTLSQDDRECLTYVIKRDVKAGISAKSILSVWPDLFPYYPYMRCSSKGEVPFPAISELKGDGIFSRWFNREKGIEAKTRNGTPLINIPDYVISDFSEIKQAVYEGEMLIEEDGKVLPREIGNGIINACFLHGKRDLESNQKLRVQLWEIIPEKDYWVGLWAVPRATRLFALEDQLMRANLESLFLTPYRIVNSRKEADDYYREIVAAGGEGTIDKDMDAPYKDGTSKGQIKNKVEEVVELRAIALIPGGEGKKNENTFGSILCESEDGLLRVACTGFSDKLRLEIFENWDYYQYKVMGVKSNGPLPPSKTNPLWSLFLPRHEDWRCNDKDTADTLERIKEVFNV
jgi:DNA ligase-1